VPREVAPLRGHYAPEKNGREGDSPEREMVRG